MSQYKIGWRSKFQTSSQIYRFKTGVPELDAALNGGIPSNLTVLILNDPENDAATFCQQLCWQGLTNNEACVYFTYDHHPDVVRKNMWRFGWDTLKYEETEDFIIVDCYSGRLGERSAEKYWLDKPFDCGKLFELFRILEKKIRVIKPGKPSRVILDSFSPIAQVTSFTEIAKLTLKLQGLAKRSTYIGIGVLHKGFHGTLNEFIAKHISEGVIELYTREENRQLKQYIRVTKMGLTKFESIEIPYTIEDRGIIAQPT
jgi:KaiC/GvpD/RAD55 family RecA-like ATPase